MPPSRSKREAARRLLEAIRPGHENATRLAAVMHLATGNFAGSLLGLAALALTARALGAAEYGQLALVFAFTRVVERVVSFQSWQPIIRYGAGLEDAEHRDDLRVLLKFGILLDIGAAICAWLVAVLIVFAAAPLFGWSTATVHLCAFYSTVLLFQVSGMPTAVLRLAGRFRVIAYGQLVNLTLKVTLCLLGVVYGAGIIYFAMVWAGTQILGSLTSLTLAILTLRSQGVRGIRRASLRGVTKRFSGIWGFAWSTNLSLTLRISTQELDTLIVGALADPASAGLYHIAKRVGRAGLQLGMQVQTVLYPDVARLWARGAIDEFRRVVVQAEVLLFGIGVLGVAVMAVIAEPLLRWTAGPSFVGAAALVIVQMVAVVFLLSGSAAGAALLAMGRQKEMLGVVFAAVAAFHATALLLIPRVGAMGGNLAHIVLGVILAVGLGLSLHRALKAAGQEAAAYARPFEPGMRKPHLAMPEGL